jgi:membrane associated rhomboid family serine protease
MSFINDIRIYLKGTYRSVVIFMIINISAFLLANILIHLVQIGGGKEQAWLIISDYFCLPGFGEALFTRFWTLGTYMFLHVDFRHILGNVLWLFFLGRIFCELLGSKKMVTVYLLGGISGGILYLLVSALLGWTEEHRLLGASASVMAIVVGVATYAPDYRVYPFGIPMKLKWLALISFILTSLLNLSDNTGGKVAHIGGALFGLLWAINYKSSSSSRKSSQNFLAGLFTRKPKLTVVHKNRNDMDYNTQKTGVKRRIDEILDKISRSGYDSLSKDDKEFLQKNHDKF